LELSGQEAVPRAYLPKRSECHQEQESRFERKIQRRDPFLLAECEHEIQFNTREDL